MNDSILRLDVNGDEVVPLFQRNLRTSAGVSSGCAANTGKDVHCGPCIVGSGRHCRYVEGVIHKSGVIMIVCGKDGFNVIPLNRKSFNVESSEKKSDCLFGP